MKSGWLVTRSGAWHTVTWNPCYNDWNLYTACGETRRLYPVVGAPPANARFCPHCRYNIVIEEGRRRR